MKNVVVGIITRNSKNKTEYLLISSKRDFGKYTGFYYPPGGHLEEGEDERRALVREIREELRVSVEPKKKIAVTPGDVKNQITHWWKCDIENYDFIIDKSELSDVGWFSRDEILNNQNVWPATKNFFKEYISD